MNWYRTFLASLTSLIICAALLFIADRMDPRLRVALGQQGVEPINAATIVEYDHDGLDVDGLPENLSHAQIGLFSGSITLPLTATTPVLAQVRGPIIAGTSQTPISSLVTGRPAGQYYLSVLAVDRSGNQSEWAAAIRVVIDLKPPKPPTGIRCAAKP